MKITLITMGHQMPRWVEEATLIYQKRLQSAYTFNLIEIPLTKRGKTADISRIIDKDTANMKAAIPHSSYLIALDVTGKTFTSEGLAKHVEALTQRAAHLCLLIGGPEGLAKPLVAQCHERWSLSTLTLPHTLVRVVFLEALYRSWCIINHHPYHK